MGNAEIQLCMLFITRNPRVGFERYVHQNDIGMMSGFKYGQCLAAVASLGKNIMSGSRLMSIAMPCRNIGWSSTNITFAFEAGIFMVPWNHLALMMHAGACGRGF